MPRGIDRDEERERARQRGRADQIASEKNPPKPSCTLRPTGQEMSYAERLTET